MSDSTEIDGFEELADTITSPPNNEAYQKANELLTAFNSELDNFDKIFFILDKTN